MWSLISFSLHVFFIITFYFLLARDRFLALSNSVSWFPFPPLPLLFDFAASNLFHIPHTFSWPWTCICLTFLWFLFSIVDATWSHRVPVTVSNTCPWINLILKSNTVRSVELSAFYTWGNEGPGKVKKLAQVTISDRPGLEARFFLTPKLMLKSLKA